MSAPGDSYRSKSLSERLAASLPAGGALAAVRRRLKPLFARWLDAGGGGLRSVLPGGEVVLVAAEFRHINWNPEEYTAFRAAVRPGAVVLEAGANVGAYTMLFAQWVGPAGRVFAFEPDPAAYAGLQQHIARNAVADRVMAVPAAVADGRASTLRLALGESSGLSRLLTPGETHAAAREVSVVSIDQFCTDRGLTPQVIKIDVEGAELAVLAGARATVAAAGPGLQLFVEMHAHLWTARGISADDVRRECEAQHLVPERLDGSRDANLWQAKGVCLRLRPAGASLTVALAKAGA